MPRGMDLYAAVETVDHSLSRISGTKTEAVGVGERVEAGDILRANDGKGSIKLPDGTRVEMSDQSELSWEPANDGVRIRLTRGSVIVNAIQGSERLYVQTRDALVLGMGSVFLVSAEPEGSRVAVIAGEVRSQNGSLEKPVLAGEQIATNPVMKTLQIQDEISWSRNAEAHVAMLQQVAAAAQKPAAEARVGFEVISIRPSAPLQARGRGTPFGNPGASDPNSEREIAFARATTCAGPGSRPEVNPGRFVFTGATVYRLLVLAYGLKDCVLALQLGLVSGGPDWVKSDRFDIQATIPEGSPVYTRQQLIDGEATSLLPMIRNLLADRFQLTLRRETRDTPTFNLVVAKAGKIKLSEDQTPPGPPPTGRGFIPGALPRGTMLNCTGTAITISAFANCIQKTVGGFIVDKTDLKGLYDIPLPASLDPSSPPLSQSFLTAQVLEQIGLKLEPTKASREVLIVERVEKPTEN